MDHDHPHPTEPRPPADADAVTDPCGPDDLLVDCQETLATRYVFLDGELAEVRRLWVERHLEGCSPCLEAYDFEAELKMVVARRCRDQVPDHLRQRVIDALVEASEAFRRR